MNTGCCAGAMGAHRVSAARALAVARPAVVVRDACSGQVMEAVSTACGPDALVQVWTGQWSLSKGRPCSSHADTLQGLQC